MVRILNRTRARASLLGLGLRSYMLYDRKVIENVAAECRNKEESIEGKFDKSPSHSALFGGVTNIRNSFFPQNRVEIIDECRPDGSMCLLAGKNEGCLLTFEQLLDDQFRLRYGRPSSCHPSHELIGR